MRFLNFALVQSKEDLISFWFQNLPALGECRWNALLLLHFSSTAALKYGIQQLGILDYIFCSKRSVFTE